MRHELVGLIWWPARAFWWRRCWDHAAVCNFCPAKADSRLHNLFTPFWIKVACSASNSSTDTLPGQLLFDLQFQGCYLYQSQTDNSRPRFCLQVDAATLTKASKDKEVSEGQMALGVKLLGWWCRVMTGCCRDRYVLFIPKQASSFQSPKEERNEPGSLCRSGWGWWLKALSQKPGSSTGGLVRQGP